MVNKQRILIVDDTPSNIEILIDLFKDEYNISAANNGIVALELVKKERPNLILLDIKMPEMDGFEVCRRFKDDPLMMDIPIIFLSGLKDEKSKVKGFEAGGVDYITKPFLPQETLTRVRTHLSMSRMQNHLEDIVRERTSKLQISEERFREFVEGTDNLVTKIDGQGRLLYVNHAAQHAFGVTPQECIGRSIFSFIDTQDRERTKKWFDQCVKSRIPSSSIDNRHISDTGEVRNMIWTVNFHYSQQGNIEYANSIARDISEQKQKEKILTTRLMLSEFSFTHTIDELLQKFLDEAEKFTGSSIGFFHFIEPDEKTLSLQVWSTNTVQRMCTTEAVDQRAIMTPT